MSPRSSRVIEILHETIRHAEQTPELGPYDPGVIELKRLLTRWVAEREALTGSKSHAERPHLKNLHVDQGIRIQLTHPGDL